MNRVNEQSKHVKAIVTLMKKIGDEHERLIAVIDKKIDAMRSADVASLTQIVNQEHAIAASIAEKEGLRAQLVERIARGYGVSARVARRMQVSQVATRFGGEHAQELLDTAEGVRERVMVVARRNHQARLIARGVVGHMQKVFAAMTGGDSGGDRYSHAGAPNCEHSIQILDAVG